MKGFIGDIEEQTEANRDFRRVLFTGPRMQLVVMALPPSEELGGGSCQHGSVFQSGGGEGKDLDGRYRAAIEGDMAIIVPAGTRHNIKNTGHKPLKLYTLYAPPQHPDGTVHRTKADAAAAVEEVAR